MTYARLAFMTLVTILLLASAFREAARGLDGGGAAVVYSLAAGFGLEYLGAAWRARYAAKAHAAARR